MSAEQAPTIEQLQAAVNAKRGQTKAPDAEQLGEIKPVTAACDRCRSDFSYVPIMLAGRQVAKRVRCDVCVEADKRAMVEAEQRQSGYAGKLEVHDKETAFRAFLDQVGGNPWEHGHASLDNFDVSEASFKPLTLAREFAEAVRDAGPYDPVRGLYFWGDTGPGKTHLTVGVVRHLIDSGYRGRIVFDHAAELIARIQDTYGRRDASTMDVLERRFEAGLWILDDFGTERPSDDVVRHLTLIFARRGMRPTLVTSNLSPAKLDAERPDLMRVMSRLGPAYFRTCEVRGRDRRFDSAAA